MLAQTISDILQCKQTIEDHKFDETATKQYIVLPILRSLDWQDDNLYTLEVFPEKKVGGGKVDYALQQDDTSLVFIECKRWGTSIEKYQAQICQYAFQAGIEIAIITNGKIWDFYLPNLTSTSARRVIPWEDRIFCSIDLEIQQEAVSDFQKYLSKSNVEQGKAKAEAPRGVSTSVVRYSSTTAELWITDSEGLRESWRFWSDPPSIRVGLSIHGFG